MPPLRAHPRLMPPFDGLIDKFKRKAFVVRSMEEQRDKSASGHELKKCLTAFDLVMLGIGGIIGAGVFVLTGVAARNYAGPAVVLSYAIGSVAAMIAAFCYAEYAVELPVAGGAFNYISLTFGEFAAWVVAMDLILEYTLSAAAVAKGFTAYLAALLGISVGKLRLAYGILTLDFPAFLAVLALSALLGKSMTESSWFNIGVTGLNVFLILFVLIMGFQHINPANYVPFIPAKFGVRGIFSGASVVFFSFIGFDTVATTAEEVKDVAAAMPIGIIGSLSICTVFYILMCVAITGMQPYYQIDMDAPFAVAFSTVGLGWAQRVVAAGALTGIVTSLLVSLLGQARIYVTLGRQHLLPPWMARVSPKTATPVNATIVTSCTAGILALLFDIEILSELVSIGTLAVFFLVCAGVLYRRYYRYSPESPSGAWKPIAWRLVAIGVTSAAFAVMFHEAPHMAYSLIFLVPWALITASFLLLPIAYTPASFKVPMVPFIPSLGMLATIFLIGSLGWIAYVRWIVWFIIGTIIYLSYGIHHSQGESPGGHTLAQPKTSDQIELGAGLDGAPDEAQVVHSGGVQVTVTTQRSPRVSVTDEGSEEDVRQALHRGARHRDETREGLLESTVPRSDARS